MSDTQNTEGTDRFIPQEQIEVLRSLNDNLTEAIYRSTRFGTILYANDAMVKMFGYDSTATLLETPMDQLYVDPSMRDHLIHRIEAEGRLKNSRIHFKRKNGTTFWSAVTCIRVTKQEDVFYDGTIVDVTDQVRKEEQLIEKTNALEKMNLQLDRFIYSASHDIRSPVSTLMGVVNLMKLDPANVTDYLKMVDNSLSKLEYFIQKLAMFKKNSYTTVESTRIDFESIMMRIRDEFRDHVHYKKLNIVRTIDLSHPFFSDQFRVELILNNIIKNAYDFCDPHKRKSFLNIQITGEQEKITIEFLDNGIGIGEPHVGRVFDMFYRGSTQSQGSGLGLYLTREAVLKLGGTIALRSESGFGTSIIATLPNLK